MIGPIIFASIFFSICAFFLIIDIVSLIRQHNKFSRIIIFKFIDKLIVVSCVIIILATLLWDFNYLRYKSSIPYKDWKTITLNDFRGLKRPYITLDGENKFAFISTGISIRKDHNEIEIQSKFHPCRSYVYNRDIFSEDLLTHELYHFHITEYFARLMRKEVKRLDSTGQIVNIKKIKNKVLLHEQELQSKYDDETYHGYISGKQIEWQNKIDSSLLSLKNYSETIISLKKQQN